MRRVHIVRGAAGVAGAFGVAELVSRTGLVDPDSLPPASVVLWRATELVVDTDFLTNVANTLKAWLGGLLLATAVAVTAGFALSSTPWLSRATRIVVEFMRPIPSVALIPLALVTFGSATQSKMSLVFYAASWPILINTLYALRDVDPLAKETLRSFGFGKGAVLLRVSLPSAAPFVATGVRIAASVGLVVVISTELVVGGGEGVGGYLMETQSGGGRPDLMLAGAVWAGMLGLLINMALVALERRAFRWHMVRTAATA
ncbi:ABC transporter permease [Actinomadura sp. HBU206391]|uniref:ABC transporter permease n=1 Tax=Actinomadura sp. HBU206391 TaxID=2731692 RepID=UPI00164FE83C|nr:ABC transporter permease subunit [Actinomadura sp. HBU206391]MBC6462578.1 ABC transporter permease subunit [Actinomadura sp. HBU206391]